MILPTTAKTQEAMQVLFKTNELKLELVKKHNHIWRIFLNKDVYYLKLFSKDWYKNDEGCSFCVRHEASMIALLQKNELATAELIQADETQENPLNWPFIITKAIEGAAIPDVLTRVFEHDFEQIMFVLGDYLRRTHAVLFNHAGYISDLAGPSHAPNENAWQHPIWTFSAFQKSAYGVWQDDAASCKNELLSSVRSYATSHETLLKLSYQQPRLIHGDAHPAQFFIKQVQSKWQVSGVLDFEVGSAGNPLADWSTLLLCLSGQHSSNQLWWQALFEGYQQTPSFELLKLFLLSKTPYEYKYLGGHYWPQERSEQLEHILRAKNWFELFALSESN